MMARVPLAAVLEAVRSGNPRHSVALCIFTVGFIISSRRYSTTASLERPVVLSAFSLLWTGLSLIFYTRWKTGERLSGRQYGRQIAQSQTRAGLLKVLAVPLALVLRAFLFRHTLWWAQCLAPGGYTFLLPALLIVADWAWPQQHGATPLATYDRSPSSPSSPQGLWTHLAKISSKKVELRQRFPLRHVALALTWAFLADYLLALTAQTTGMVCPSGTLWPAAGFVQLLVLGLDASALYLVGRRRREVYVQAEEKSAAPAEVNRGCRLAEECVLAAVAMLVLLVVTAPFATTSWREMAATASFRGLVVGHLLLDSLLAAGVLLSGLYLLGYMTPTTLALVGGAAFISVHPNLQPSTGHGIAHPTPAVAITIAILAILSLALLSHHTIRLATEQTPHHKRRLTTTLAILTLLLTTTTTRTLLLAHPKDALAIVQASQQRSNEWIAAAAAAAAEETSASTAAAAYKARYANLPPPPLFAQWHAYAHTQRSPIIVPFDQIHTDLLPFWGLPPAELRARTAHLLAQRNLGIGGLRIRNGAVEIAGAGVPDTHRWMMEAWRDMVAPFAATLPDMEVAFNLDDEARVAVPAGEMARLRAAGEAPRNVLAASKGEGHPLRGWFSTSAESPWGDDSTTGGAAPRRSKYFSRKKPRLGVYDTYIAPTCAAGSAALRQRWWSGQRAMPEVQGGVIASTPDLCDRPDLAQMHGFLVSPGGPGGLAVTQRAMPVFSQSRAGGFGDILVPSPWHFADKVGVNETADEEWRAKKDTVFWRGTASDGFAEGDKWPGFVRARLVNLARAFVERRRGLALGLRDAPAVDVAFSGKFTHCDPAECRGMVAAFYGGGQEVELAKSDFQDHWAYRHLIDVDGAGFSGRFLPFLRSKSTVYRATLFRTWYDERVHPWKHFVPLDVSLSGLWDVIWLVSRKLVVKDADTETPLAQAIAADGHDWAAKALRKEDMQVYMFRLLLEWGRLVDDDREELGYDP